MVYLNRYLSHDFCPLYLDSKKTQILIKELKTYVRYLLLTIILVESSLLLLLQLNLSSNRKPIFQNQIVSRISPRLPTRLTIPKINVSTNIQQVGVTSKGEMDVPSNTTDVGWLNLGPRPGEKGSAVIDGHFNKENGEAGVFFNLYKLKKGDKLYIADDKGTSTTFVVRESRTYNPGYAEDVFSSEDNAHLNLITCDGVWDGARKNYTKRLVVFADIAQ